MIMTSIDYSSPVNALTGILEWLEEKIDLQHIAAVEDRHIKALQWQPVVNAPLTYLAPVASPFAPYPYGEVYQDHVKMLVNELVGPYAALGPTASIVNSVKIRDDFPLQIRAFYGVGLMASLFEAESVVTENNYPWVKPLGLEKTKQLVAKGVPDLMNGLVPRVLETMQFYKEALMPYPICSQAIHITQPDMQGPFDIAAQLWGSEIFTAFYDCPELIVELLDLIAETYIQACRLFANASSETIGDGFIALHYTICKGHCLLKDDSSVMVSPRTYLRFIRPANEKILTALGGGGIHFCGVGDQWKKEFVDTQGLMGVDFGQLYLNNLSAWAEILRAKKIPIVNTDWTLDAFKETAPTRIFPTGASFAVTVDNLEVINAMAE
jgi:hypothetical protein